MAIATRSNKTWLHNAARLLGKPSRRTPNGARWWGLVRMLNWEVGLSLRSAARVADLSLGMTDAPHRVRLAATADGAVALRIDLERFNSTANASLSAALVFGSSHGRGRPRLPEQRNSPVDDFPGVWEIRVERETGKLDRLAGQLRAWNAYPRAIEPGLSFILDSATLLAVPRLALATSKGDIDVEVVEPPGAHGDQGT